MSNSYKKIFIVLFLVGLLQGDLQAAQDEGSTKFTFEVPGTGKSVTVDAPDNIYAPALDENFFKEQLKKFFLAPESKLDEFRSYFGDEALDTAKSLRGMTAEEFPHYENYLNLQNEKEKLSSGEGPICVIYSHGFGETENDAKVKVAMYKSQFYEHKKAYTVYSDAASDKHEFRKTYMAQKGDVAVLENKIKITKQKIPNARIVLFGYSRGAATIINLLGRTKTEGITAAILVAPFASGDNIIKTKLKQLDVAKIVAAKGFLAKGIHKLGKAVFPRYNPGGMQPIVEAEYIDKKIPILFITSKKDLLCPPSGVKKLYKKIYKSRDKKEKKVHLVELDHGGHLDYFNNGKNYISENDKDTHKNFSKITNLIKAFYTTYNIPFLYSDLFVSINESLLQKFTTDYQPNPELWEKKKKKRTGIKGLFRSKAE